jgi:nucleotide-binding universal stress UspA family protein
MKTKNFIVPYDFTVVSSVALEHAIASAKPLKAVVFLLHLVSKKKDLQGAELKLQDIISQTKTVVKIIPFVRVGNIFTDIGGFAAEHRAELIFMGTHGTQGWQKITGMNALKVITHSSVPFIVVQEKTAKETGYDDIIVPLDLNKETKQKLSIVANIARYFKSKVHVVSPKEPDEFLKHKVKGNLLFAEKYFAERGVAITAKIVPRDGFDKEVVKHAVNIDADLIAIMNLNRNNLFGVLTATHEEYIITNDAHIPALIVNPIEDINVLPVG